MYKGEHNYPKLYWFEKSKLPKEWKDGRIVLFGKFIKGLMYEGIAARFRYQEWHGPEGIFKARTIDHMTHVCRCDDEIREPQTMRQQLEYLSIDRNDDDNE